MEEVVVRCLENEVYNLSVDESSWDTKALNIVWQRIVRWGYVLLQTTQ